MLRAIALAWSLMSATLAAQVVVGSVIDSITKSGIKGVRVRFFTAGNSPASKDYSAVTDSDGLFRIEGVADGAYRARYNTSGYTSVPNGGNVLPAFAVIGGNEPVRLDPIEMQPMAKLFGRVLDSSKSPVPNAVVWLIKSYGRCSPPLCFPEYRPLTTNQNGEYAADQVVPGAWLVSATAPPSWKAPQFRTEERLGWAQTFYPGVIDSHLAEPLMVRGGEQWSPDIQLAARTLRRVSGRVLDQRGKPVPGAPVIVSKDIGPNRIQQADDHGAFEFWVVDSAWRISVNVENNGFKLKAANFVDVRGRDIDNIELRLTASLSLRGKIITKAPEGVAAPPLPPIDLVLVSSAAVLSDGVEAFVPVRIDGGNLTVDNIFPGTYTLQVLSQSAVPYYLDSIRFGDDDGVESLKIISDTQTLIVTYQLGGGTVRGSVKACGTARPLLIPQEVELRRNGFVRVADCDSNGQFAFSAVRPGKYFVLAAEGGPASYMTLFRDEGLLNRSFSVTVRPNDSTSTEIR